MLENARLYKDEKGQIWHVKSDGTAVKYPQFEVYAEIPKGVYEEISFEEHGIDVSDELYLAERYFSYHLCVIPQHEEDFRCADNAFDVLSGEWIHLYGLDWILFDVVNLEKVTKYLSDSEK